MDSVEGDVTLGRAVSDETFAPIFKPEEVEHPDQGEVIYADPRHQTGVVPALELA